MSSPECSRWERVAYGHNDVWQFYASDTRPDTHARADWRTRLDTPGAAQMGHIRKLMESRPVGSRIADQGLLTWDYGTGSDHQRATRDESGTYAMVYTPNGKPITFKVQNLAGAKVNAWWFNPRTGQATWVGQFDKTQRTFTPPTNGKHNDWVLVIDDASKNYKAPGTR